MNIGEDIVLITVDCWRFDDLARMKSLDALAADWSSGSCITASPHTPGAFPALFASTYFPDLYSENRTIPEDTKSLPRLLTERGYNTGGFVASNTMLDAWSEHFDEYWNDGFHADGIDESERLSNDSMLSNALDHLTLTADVTAGDAFERAEAW